MFGAFEMFAWKTKAKDMFKGYPPEFFDQSSVLAANQGLYNYFLAAGLIWSLLISDPDWQYNISTFFLSCIIVAGVYGAVTASKTIFFIQALPAIIAILILLLSKA